MSGYLLDTNVLSELIRPEPDRRVARWVESVDEQLLHVSVLTLGEIRRGISRLAAGSRRLSLERWFQQELVPRFRGRTLAIDLEIAERWGELTATASKAGRPLPVIDSLLAATALEHSLVMVTRNAKHFAATDVLLLDPWNP